MADLTDDGLSDLRRAEVSVVQCRRAYREIVKHREMCRRLEEWALQLEAESTSSGVGRFIAEELRNRMKGSAR